MFNTKILLAAASLAVLSAAGIGTASAAPWDHHGRRDRAFERHERFEHRALSNRVPRLSTPCASIITAMIGDPYFRPWPLCRAHP